LPWLLPAALRFRRHLWYGRTDGSVVSFKEDVMRTRLNVFTVALTGLLGLGACSSNGGSTGGTGGASGSGGAGSGGSVGTGGATAGTGGATAGTGGVTAGSGGTIAGSGGASIDAPADVPAADAPSGGDVSPTSMSMFITSDKSMTGNLGGLTGADKRCQDLAVAAGQGSKTWHAYVSVEMGPAGTPINAKDRIGNGPWYNAKGTMVAMNVADLHTKNGDYMVFVDEKGQPIPGHWTGSPPTVEHDILTGSNRDGTVMAGNTCKSWTSAATTDKAFVGHTDGLGPGGSTAAMYRPWNSSHANMDCSNTVPLGGAGRIACFAVN
jgi:hypothetical protein